jgi:hypothetical protein
MSDKQSQKESQMRADLSRRLQEKLQSETEFIGKIVEGTKPPESKEKDC